MEQVQFQEAYERMEQWLFRPDLSPELKRELQTLQERMTSDAGDQEARDEIFDRFYKNLDFGTGGLRGYLGAGTNRMNLYSTRRVSQGFANYLAAKYADGEKPLAVAIAYDSRINSTRFALETAGVFLANGFMVYLFPELMPTPALSFAVRHYGCVGGVMITASHNPAIYNGYKVYNDEGCQVTLQAAEEILSATNEIGYFEGIKTLEMEFEAYVDRVSDLAGQVPQLLIIPPETEEAYFEAVKDRRAGISCDNLEVVYTPLNGAGNKPVRRILKDIGVEKLHIVGEQELPDGNFPTCPYPNPEKVQTLELGLSMCKELETPDLLLATDPDCDRLSVAVRKVNGKTGEVGYQLLSGNEVGILLLDFLCENRPLPERPIAIKTIVSSKMANAVANKYGAYMMNVLTGFKFIGEQIGMMEKREEVDRYIFGFEESSGYLSGPYVRDKDAVNAAMLVCEAAALYKGQGKTLLNRMEELYQEYGYYRSSLLEFDFEGASGMEKMNGFLKLLRENPPAGIVGAKVVEIADYLTGQRHVYGTTSAMASGYKPTRLPKSDVLEYVLSDGSSIIIRPSGTEPKLKVYLSAKASTKFDADIIIEDMEYTIKGWLR